MYRCMPLVVCSVNVST